MSIEYYAGLFDGEGCVSVFPRHKRKNFSLNLRAEIYNTDIRPLLKLQKEFKGRIFSQSRKPNKTLYTWSAPVLDAERFFRAIRRHTIIKREQIDVALDYYKEVKKEERHGRGHGMTPAQVIFRKRTYKILRRMKHGK